MHTIAEVRRWVLGSASLCLLLFVSPLRAEVKVTLSETHLCCGMCYRAVDETLGKVEGVTHQTDREKKTITVTAADQSGVQKAIDALALAGFHGKLDNSQVTFKKVEAPQGAVTRLEVSGVHNCCGACTTALKRIVTGVTGVASENIATRQSSFVVQGEFTASDVVDALLAAGFYAQVK
jgi:copper chaperone CopZ